jgi:hypothetical protein
LPESDKENTSKLKYRSIFAVLTWDSVIVYDTYHSHPLAVVRNLHYAHLVDATWSADGQKLIVCSSDGYMSFLLFEEGELGKIYNGQQAATGVDEAKSIGQQQTSQAASTIPVAAACSTLLLPSLPPCEPGLSIVTGPPTKKSRTEPSSPSIDDTTTAAASEATHKRPAEMAADIDKLCITSGSEKKKKKRIQPTLMSVQ